MPTIDELADASTVAGTDRIIIQQATNESSKKATVSQLNLDNLGFTPTDGNILVGDGTNFVEESGATARTSLGVDAAGTDNSTDVTLAGTPDYITLSGQVLTRNQVDLTADVTGDLPVTEGGTGVSSLTNGGVLLGSGTGAVTAMAVLADGEMIVGDGTTDPVAESGATLRTSIGVDAAGTDNSTDVTLTGTPDYITISGQVITRGSIDLTSDVTGDLPVAEGGTGSSTASGARTNLGAAASGANTDITSLALADGDLVRPVIKDYGETLTTANTSTTYTIDLENGNTFELTLTGNCTYTFSNPPATGTMGSFTLKQIQDGTGSRTVTWPTSVDWAGGSAPTITTTAASVDFFTFVTEDGGTTWYGFTGGQDFS